MRFITEDDLRSLYRTNAFTSYEPEPGVKLTPGARQFLADRGMLRFDTEAANAGFRTANLVGSGSQSGGSGDNQRNAAKRERLLSGIKHIETNIQEIHTLLSELKTELDAED